MLAKPGPLPQSEFHPEPIYGISGTPITVLDLTLDGSSMLRDFLCFVLGSQQPCIMGIFSAMKECICKERADPEEYFQGYSCC